MRIAIWDSLSHAIEVTSNWHSAMHSTAINAMLDSSVVWQNIKLYLSSI